MGMIDCRGEADWLEQALENVHDFGFVVVTGVLDDDLVAETRERMYSVRDQILRDVGAARLARAGEIGVLRLMMKFDRHFARFLEIPEMLRAVDAMVSPTAVLHTQNGFVLPSKPARRMTPTVFQNTFRRDFPRHMNGYIASVNALFMISDFTVETGATYVVPRTHQHAEVPDADYLATEAVVAEGSAGSMIVFDSTLLHAAGNNVSGKDRMGINHQFTRSFFKQQIDYVRALGDEYVSGLPERSQQLLGWYTRVPTNLDEYYQPTEKRLYRGGQG